MQNQSESFRLTLILCQTTEAANDRALASQSRVATIASLKPARTQRIDRVEAIENSLSLPLQELTAIDSPE